MSSLDIVEFALMFVVYIPTIISFSIYFRFFRRMKDKGFKYFIFPISLVVSIAPFVNMLSLSCIYLNCFDNENNISEDKK